MLQKHLHVISFNVPFPADYGGVIDVFYRLNALKNAGIKIYLHCFDYGRGKHKELDAICDVVYYYPRPKSILYQFSILPFIVNTRRNKELLTNLLANDYPILFEGLHSCYFLDYRKLLGRNKIVRTHNIEHHYYKSLSNKALNFKEQLFFNIEAFRLKRFERILKTANHIAAISETDMVYFENKFGKTFLLPPSHPNEQVVIIGGRGDYILYHGNLSVNENEEAVLFILDRIASNISHKIVIAGKNPSKAIEQKVHLLSNVELKRNPSFKEMSKLVSEAHINLLPTFQPTGFKLKLLNALFNGRFCIGTTELIEGTGLEELCIVTNSHEKMISEINRLFDSEFTFDEIEKRKALLFKYSNSAVISSLLNRI